MMGQMDEEPPVMEEDALAELRVGNEVKAGVAWVGRRLRDVKYTIVDGNAIVEGCIILGSAARIQRLTEIVEPTRLGEDQYGAVITGPEYRWPNRTVPFELDASLDNPDWVREAIEHWRDHVSIIKFVERTSANEHLYPNWVTFVAGGGCSSSVGCQKDQQLIKLGPNCQVGNIIHEIGHAVGLWHEQSREDRGAHVDIVWQNIEPGTEHNFEQQIWDGDDVGPYDYGSIMHYSRTAFSVNGQDTILPKNGAQIGQRVALSDQDIATVNSIYV